MAEITSKEYCDTLRKLGVKLASGELDEYRLDMTQLSENMNTDDFMKVSKGTSYSRTIINRVPEVKAAGAISIKVEEDDFARYFVFKLNRDVKRKVLTSEDIGKLEHDWKSKFIKHLLQTHPKFTDLEGERLAGAVEMIRRYEEMLTNIAKGE